MNPAANGECGAWSALNWGSFNQTTTVNPDVLEGWGTRNRDWQYRRRRAAGNRAAGRGGGQLQPAGVEQLLRHAQPRAHGRGLRRGHADRALGSAPAQRRRLPGHVPHPQHAERRSARPTRTTRPPTTTVTRRTTGTASTCRSTPGRGTAWCVQGGTSTGRGVNDTCDVADRRGSGGRWRPHSAIAVPSPPRASSTVRRSCDVAEPWLTSVRGLGSYTVPKVDVLVSAIFRSQANAQPGCRRGHERRVADGNLSHDGRAVPGRNGTAAGARVGHPGRGPPAAGRGVRRPHQRRGHALRQGPAVRQDAERTSAWTCTTCSTPTRRRPTRPSTTRRRTGRDGCSRRPCCCRGSCGSTCSWISRAASVSLRRAHASACALRCAAAKHPRRLKPPLYTEILPISLAEDHI